MYNNAAKKSVDILFGTFKVIMSQISQVRSPSVLVAFMLARTLANLMRHWREKTK